MAKNYINAIGSHRGIILHYAITLLRYYNTWQKKNFINAVSRVRDNIALQSLLLNWTEVDKKDYLNTNHGVRLNFALLL